MLQQVSQENLAAELVSALCLKGGCLSKQGSLWRELLQHILNMPVDVDAYSNNGNHAAPWIMAGFNQNTSDFSLSNENIVRPFDSGGYASGFSDCVNDSQRSNHYEQVRRECWSQYGGGEDIPSWHIYPPVTLPAFSSALIISKHHQPFIWPFKSQVHCQRIG